MYSLECLVTPIPLLIKIMGHFFAINYFSTVSDKMINNNN